MAYRCWEHLKHTSRRAKLFVWHCKTPRPPRKQLSRQKDRDDALGAAYVRADPVALLGLLPLAALVLAEADGRRCLAAVRLRQVELTLEQIREQRAIQFGPQRQRTNLSSAECRGGCV